MPSFGLQIVFAAFQYMGTLANTTLPQFETFIPLLALSLCISFFEAVFWRGWVLLRLEEAFGLVPAILLGSLLYAAYHIGYAMPMSEMVFLFFIGDVCDCLSPYEKYLHPLADLSADGATGDIDQRWP